jgi:hypothetical protein
MKKAKLLFLLALSTNLDNLHAQQNNLNFDCSGSISWKDGGIECQNNIFKIKWLNGFVNVDLNKNEVVVDWDTGSVVVDWKSGIVKVDWGTGKVSVDWFKLIIEVMSQAFSNSSRTARLLSSFDESTNNHVNGLKLMNNETCDKLGKEISTLKESMYENMFNSLIVNKESPYKILRTVKRTERKIKRLSKSTDKISSSAAIIRELKRM